MSIATLTTVPLDQLHPHPDNPRITFREDVVDSLLVQMKQGLSQEYALIVRPVGDGYQIVSGHHRYEAGVRLALPELPCWIRDMSDDEAFMQLVLGNTQGELSPLEIGLHALKAVPLEQGKAGGGLSAYAETLGRDKSGISHLRNAASVFRLVETSTQVNLRDKANHLYEISKANNTHWQTLVDQLVAESWTVKQAAAAVQKIRDDELRLLETEQRAKQREIDARQFIQDKAPSLLKEIGKEKRFISASVAKSHWETENRKEAARLEQERRKKEEWAAKERQARSDLYSGIARSLITIGEYGGYEDISKLMAGYNPAELTPIQLSRGLSSDNLQSGAKFISELIKWKSINGS